MPRLRCPMEPAEKEGAVLEDIVPDERKEELQCFVSFADMSEPDVLLGLGLYVHPLKKKERERGKMEIDIVFDYLTMATFQEGINFHTVPEDDSDSFIADSEDEETEQPLPSMTSSMRRRINGWLPLFISSQHWARARLMAAESFALLATGRQNMCFEPLDALDVCCKLLTCAVVGFTVGQPSGGIGDAVCDERAKGRGKASDRAVQMYADVHRLFLQMAHEYPEVRREALDRLRRFIRHPAGRTRDKTPNLGDLIQYLLVTEDISWEDLAPSFIPEALRRHVGRGIARQKFQHQSWLDYSGTEDFNSSSCSTVEDIICAFNKFAPKAGMVSSFCVMFYRCVGRPQGFTLSQVQEEYDKTWGHLAQASREEIVAKCSRLCQLDSVSDILPPMFPSGSCSDEDVAELILWAEWQGGRWRNEAIPVEQWTALDAPHPLLEAWKTQPIGTQRQKGGGWRRYCQKEWEIRTGCKGKGQVSRAKANGTRPRGTRGGQREWRDGFQRWASAGAKGDGKATGSTENGVWREGAKGNGKGMPTHLQQDAAYARQAHDGYWQMQNTQAEVQQYQTGMLQYASAGAYGNTSYDASSCWAWYPQQAMDFHSGSAVAWNNSWGE